MLVSRCQITCGVHQGIRSRCKAFVKLSLPITVKTRICHVLQFNLIYNYLSLLNLTSLPVKIQGICNLHVFDIGSRISHFISTNCSVPLWVSPPEQNQCALL